MSNITDTDFTEEFQIFFEGCKKINSDYIDRSFPVLAGYTGVRKDVFSFSQGRRYIKVIRGGSVHCFVDRTNGDVLKAASWKAPAKHARGNLFDKDNGLGSMGEFGPAYLRG